MSADVISVKIKFEQYFLSIRGVVGVSADKLNNRIIVYVSDITVCNRIPRYIEGYPVVCEVVGSIKPL